MYVWGADVNGMLGFQGGIKVFWGKYLFFHAFLCRFDRLLQLKLFARRFCASSAATLMGFEGWSPIYYNLLTSVSKSDSGRLAALAIYYRQIYALSSSGFTVQSFIYMIHSFSIDSFSWIFSTETLGLNLALPIMCSLVKGFSIGRLICQIVGVVEQYLFVRGRYQPLLDSTQFWNRKLFGFSKHDYCLAVLPGIVRCKRVGGWLGTSGCCIGISPR